MLLGRDRIKRIPWPQLFVEAAFVVLSVLLALALNGWRQREVQEDLAVQALRNIEDEIRVNKARVEEALSYHGALIGSMEGDDPSPDVALKPALIQDNAWETAQATQAVAYLDYDVVSQVSEIHELQSMYNQVSQGVMQVLYMGPNPGRERAQLAMLYDLRGFEQLLLQSYEELLKMLEA